MFSGYTTMIEVRSRLRNRDESLHYVSGQIIGDLGGAERLAAMPRAQRRQLLEAKLNETYEFSPDQLAHGLRDRVLENLTNLLSSAEPIHHPRIRSLLHNGQPLTPESLEAIVNRSASSGLNSTATTADDAAMFFPDRLSTNPDNMIMFVYPRGTPGVVINGEGKVTETAFRCPWATLIRNRPAGHAVGFGNRF